eukprot:TRINITY_DN8611_c0_g1_i5.p1 TRINITY_DN8611_c0_g1~~TRINITY_DN8611_c0_g1_i5.p1  ORF type:complete len:202 (+),score=30.95 TRINITY_DN8611_c0_g1_i5:35-640(+)
MALRLAKNLRAVARARRWCTEHPTVYPVMGDDTLKNPLAEDELKVHQEAERKWMAFSNRIIEARKVGEEERLKVIDEGLELSRSLGVELRRPGYESALNLEAAAVFKARGDMEMACTRCEAAEKAYELDKDTAGMMEARSQKAFLHLDLKRYAEAAEAFQSIVKWAETDARRATPMAQSVCQAKFVPGPPGFFWGQFPPID